MAEQSIREELAEHDFFRGLKSEHIDFLAECAKPTHLDTDVVLFQEDHKADRFYLLRNGAITLEIPAISGPQLEVQTLKGNEILGWSWLIAPYKWHFQARAEQPTDLLEFDGDAIRKRCEDDPDFGYEILKLFSGLMSERLKAAREVMMDEWNPPGFA